MTILPACLAEYAAGRQVFVSDRSIAALKSMGGTGRQVAAGLGAAFAIHRVEAAGFAGSRLSLRR